MFLPHNSSKISSCFGTSTFFPVPQTEYRPLFLDAADCSLNEQSVSEKSEERYSALKSDKQQDSTSWDYIFGEAIDLIGHIKLKLWVSTEGGDDLDLHVALKKIDKHGNEVFFPDFQHVERGLAASGWLRVSHRELDEERSNIYQPWLNHKRLLTLSPQEVVSCEIEILPSATGFLKGDKLRLIVQGYDVLNIFNRFKHEETVNRGQHIIYTGGQYDSHLLVPVVPL